MSIESQKLDSKSLRTIKNNNQLLLNTAIDIGVSDKIFYFLKQERDISLNNYRKGMKL